MVVERVQFSRRLPGSACHVPSAGKVFALWLDAKYRIVNRYIFLKVVNAVAAQIGLLPQHEGGSEGVTMPRGSISTWGADCGCTGLWKI